MTTTITTGHPAPPEPTTAPIRRAARIAGVSYLVMFALAIASNQAVNQGVFEPGDATATLANVTGSLGMFRLGVVGFTVIAILDVVIAWGLHAVFQQVDRNLSLAAAWFRLAYSAVLAVAVAPLFNVIQLIDGGLDIGTDQIATQTMSALADFHTTWMLGLALFGVHLVIVGRLVLRSGFVSGRLGYVLMAAGAAYGVDTLARILVTDYESVASILLAAVALPSMIGEGWLGVWLLLSRRTGAEPRHTAAGNTTDVHPTNTRGART